MKMNTQNSGLEDSLVEGWGKANIFKHIYEGGVVDGKYLKGQYLAVIESLKRHGEISRNYIPKISEFQQKVGRDLLYHEASKAKELIDKYKKKINTYAVKCWLALSLSGASFYIGSQLENRDLNVSDVVGFGALAFTSYFGAKIIDGISKKRSLSKKQKQIRDDINSLGNNPNHPYSISKSDFKSYE